jgi:hypothetical protein
VVKQKQSPDAKEQQLKSLMPFVGNPRTDMPKGLPFKLRDYLELVDWTARQVRVGKRGSLDSSAPPLLERLGMQSENWFAASCHFESKFKTLVGAKNTLERACSELCRLRRVGLAGARLLS